MTTFSGTNPKYANFQELIQNTELLRVKSSQCISSRCSILCVICSSPPALHLVCYIYGNKNLMRNACKTSNKINGQTVWELIPNVNKQSDKVEVNCNMKQTHKQSLEP